jgi:predicted TIM-barrel fold metal-dependent hydrolase
MHGAMNPRWKRGAMNPRQRRGELPVPFDVGSSFVYRVAMPLRSAPGARRHESAPGARRVVDFHVHAFPDGLAGKAVSRIQELARLTPALDGRLSSLLASMDAAGVGRSVVLSIATRPQHFESIRAWSRDVASHRIIPMLSVHPADASAADRIRAAADEGFKGFKLHPYYQDFDLDDQAVDHVYAALEETGLLCVAHTGFDTAYPMIRKADPPRIVRVLDRFPRLRFVATHLGAWKDWDLVTKHLAGAALWIDTSYSLDFMTREQARELIGFFPADRVLFGSDSPWADQSRSIAALRGLGLGIEREEAILSGNAENLLGL